MTELLAVAIGVGLAVSLLFSELFGLAAGGMVVPGYIAVSLDRPLDVITTLVAALLCYMSVLSPLESVESAAISEMSVIGFIVPGLIALWIDRQGVVETLSTLLIASVAVRLLLIIALAPELVS